MNAFMRLAFLVALLLMIFGSLGAQQTGEIRGKITEEKGEILAGVAVTAKSPSLQGLRTAVSDKEGFFSGSLCYLSASTRSPSSFPDSKKRRSKAKTSIWDSQPVSRLS
jgi:hypothetical protein